MVVVTVRSKVMVERGQGWKMAKVHRLGAIVCFLCLAVSVVVEVHMWKVICTVLVDSDPIFVIAHLFYFIFIFLIIPSSFLIYFLI